MFLNDGSESLFRALKEILKGRRLRVGTIEYLAIFLVAAIVLDSFLVTAFVFVMLLIRLFFRY